MPLPFENVREKLLRAGIAPRHASRYVTELREHLADLTARERASGSDAKQAADRAKALLGGDAELAQAMIDKGAPRALAARAPWVVFAVLPVALIGAMICATAFSMTHRHLVAPPEVPESHQGLIAVMSFVARYLVGPLLMAGCITIALRQRLASRWVWIGLGLVALFSGLFGLQIISAAGHEGGTIFSTIVMVYWRGHWSTVATFGMGALRAAILFALAATAYRFLRARLMPLYM